LPDHRERAAGVGSGDRYRDGEHHFSLAAWIEPVWLPGSSGSFHGAVTPGAAGVNLSSRNMAQDPPRFRFDREEGRMETQGRWSRQGWLAAVAIYDIHHFELHAIDVRAYGEVAIALIEYWQEANVSGAVCSGSCQITDVWVQRDGRWQVVARSSIHPAVSSPTTLAT
jgi:hypothetical protein